MTRRIDFVSLLRIAVLAAAAGALAWQVGTLLRPADLEAAVVQAECDRCHSPETLGNGSGGTGGFTEGPQPFSFDEKPGTFCGPWSGEKECFSYSVETCGTLEFILNWVGGSVENCATQTYTWYYR